MWLSTGRPAAPRSPATGAKLSPPIPKAGWTERGEEPGVCVCVCDTVEQTEG